MHWLRMGMAALALLLTLSPALAEPLTIAGTVSLRERIALPPGARLEVTLVHLPAATKVVGAAADIPVNGGVPLTFTLNIRDADPRASVALLARISSQGRVLFRSPRPVPVDLLAAGSVGLIVHYAPDPLPPAAPPAPVPTRTEGLHEVLWTLTSIGGRPVTGDRPLTLAIAADNRAGGNGGCNEYFAEALLVDTALSFGPAAATRIACAEDIMAQEATYFAALAAVAAFELEGNSLRLLDAAGIPLIGLVRSKE